MNELGSPLKPGTAGSMGKEGAGERVEFSLKAEAKQSGLCGDAITKENLLLMIPPALTQDTSILALAETDAEALAVRLTEIDRVRIVPNIDRLDERLLDILAYDFKVDWWDPNYTLEEKRRTLKDSWRVHKLLGTRAAVELGIRAIYPQARVEEWFEYEGGKPYHFKLHIDLSQEQWVEGKPWRALERVNYYKSLRSHMDRFEFTVKLGAPVVLGLGGCMNTQVRLTVPEVRRGPRLTRAVRVGGRMAVRVRVAVPELA